MRSTSFAALALAAAPLAANARLWIPTIHGNGYKQGGSLMAQYGAPTTSQLAVNAESLNNSQTGLWDGYECLWDDTGGQQLNPKYTYVAGETSCPNHGYTKQNPPEFIAITDHSISLVPKPGVSDGGRNTSIKKQWTANGFSGMGSTNWGGTSGNAMAQAYMSTVGDQANQNTGNDAAKSSLSVSYVSYFMKEAPNSDPKDQGVLGADIDLQENQFLVNMPGGVIQYVPGCPNYSPGQTSGACPSKKVKPGAFKFSILGRLSGTMLNSDEPGFAQNTSSFSSPGAAYRNLADYQTILYRTTIDVGAMSAASKAQMTVTLKDGTVKPFSDFDAADNDIDISGGSLNIGHMEVAFEPNLSMGDYALPLAALKKDLPNEEWPCDSSQGGMDSCAFDYTGYKDAPNAFPMGANLGIKKVGNGCQTAEWCKAWEEFADTGTPEKRQAIADAMSTVYSGCETGTMANGVCPQPAESGAVKLEVDEVVAMKVTMRKSTGCDISQRPAVPDGVDSTGQSGTSWTSLPADHDCPWWLLATGHSDSGTPPWAIPAASNDPLSGVSIKLEDKTNCASGDCYLVDFHIPLEDANGVRNVLGSVANDYERGWQKGSFFMYDPEVKTPLPPKQSGSSGGNSGGENVGGAMATFSSGALACALMGTVVAVAMGRD